MTIAIVAVAVVVAVTMELDQLITMELDQLVTMELDQQGRKLRLTRPPIIILKIGHVGCSL